MFGWLRRRAKFRRIGHELYEGIVAQARHEAFYRDLRVGDTMAGRFEMIVLHLFIVLNRLKSEGITGQRLGQILIENLVADMDDALRQIGIGDMGVPKRVGRAAAALAERSADYENGCRAPEAARNPDPLAAALARHIFSMEASGPTPSGAGQLAEYVRSAIARLAAMPAEALYRGQLVFPDIANSRPTPTGADT